MAMGDEWDVSGARVGREWDVSGSSFTEIFENGMGMGFKLNVRHIMIYFMFTIYINGIHIIQIIS